MLLTFQTAEENVSGCDGRVSLRSPAPRRSTVSLEEQSERTNVHPVFNVLLNSCEHFPERVCLVFSSRCVCAASLHTYLFEVGVFRDLHQLHLLFLSLDHERLLDVVCGAAVQRHRHHLNNRMQRNRAATVTCWSHLFRGWRQPACLTWSCRCWLL